MNQKKVTSNKGKKGIWKRVLVIFVVFILLSGSYIGYRAWNFLKGLNNGSDPNLVNEPGKDETINVLLMGVDQIPGRSDTLIFISYNPTTEKVLALSIPRDTKTVVPGNWKSSGKPYGLQKINHAHSFGGIPLAIDTVKRFLGVDIHYYARIEYKALHKLVDAVGGVPMDIKFNMNYDDNAGNLHIHFKKGPTVLNGQQAEEFLRWRKNNDFTGDGLGDLGRVQRQQEFLKSALAQFLKPKTLLNINEIESIVKDSIDTNMPASFMLKMFKDVVLGFDYDKNLAFKTVPGDYSEGNATYWIVNDDARVELDKILQSHLAPNIDKTVNIKVLNGTTERGIASDVADMLNKYPNIKAVAGNYQKSNVKVTEIINYTDDSIAKYIAGMVNGEFNIYQGTNEDNAEDIVIILGEDYKTS